jgi:hypothetical protein
VFSGCVLFCREVMRKLWAWNNFRKILSLLQRSQIFFFLNSLEQKKRVFLEKIRKCFCRSINEWTCV